MTFLGYKMKVIIAGSRDFSNYDMLKNYIDNYRKEVSEIEEIVCGCARGADTLGKRYAIENNIKVVEFPAKWDMYGKSAGYIRNEEMSKYADGLIAFWDGKSKGTKNMIELMAKKNNWDLNTPNVKVCIY